MNAVQSGRQLEERVAALAYELDLSVRTQFRVGRRVWGAERRIDVLLTEPATRNRLGIECKAQDSRGSAEERLFATLRDMESWPVRGLLVLDGVGFSDALRSSITASGKAVDLVDLETWLRLFFRLDLPERP